MTSDIAAQIAHCHKIAALRASLWANGYRPLAVTSPAADDPSAGKRPDGRAWQTRARAIIPEAATTDASPYSLNTGILCDGLRALDIDVDDALLVRQIEVRAVMYLGVAPVRFRDNSVRTLWLYRAAEGEPGKRSVTAPSGFKVEVLGRGQQFVAHGTHPSGVAIAWRPAPDGAAWAGRLPACHDLPIVTEQQITDMLREAAKLFGTPPEGGQPVVASRRLSATRPGGSPQPNVSTETVEAILALLPNSHDFADRTRWVGFAHAIASAFESDLDRGRDAWMEWCGRWTGPVDDDAAEAVWESIIPELHTADVRSILGAARHAGIDLHAWLCGRGPPVGPGRVHCDGDHASSCCLPLRRPFAGAFDPST